MEETKKNEHYMRVRPRDGSNPAFYAPAADITHGMKGVMSAALRVFDEWEDTSRLSQTVKIIATHMNQAVVSDARWEHDGLEGVDAILLSMNREERELFLKGFFRAVMDFHWHSMRLTTESPEINPKEMAEALNVSETLRNMPKKMREEYLEHMREFNKLPPVMDSKGLFKAEAVHDSK